MNLTFLPVLTSAAALLTLVLFTSVELGYSAAAHRIQAFLSNNEGAARTAVATAIATTMVNGDPQSATFPDTIRVNVSPCSGGGTTDPLCADTIDIVATKEGVYTGSSSGTTQAVPNFNRATSSNAITGQSGTPIQGRAVYSYVMTLTAPTGHVMGRRYAELGMTPTNDPSNPVSLDAIADPHGNAMGGFNRATTAGQCGGVGDPTCSLAAQPTPQPGVAALVTDTRIFGQLPCATQTPSTLCTPTGNPLVTPQPNNKFVNTLTPDNSNSGAFTSH